MPEENYSGRLQVSVTARYGNRNIYLKNNYCCCLFGTWNIQFTAFYTKKKMSHTKCILHNSYKQ